ncbi:MAG: hypothetical protein K5989_12380 [Lachnospiraceae bacterium]|nr:hypothetical protein [Lachnospiraceae bacterium]
MKNIKKTLTGLFCGLCVSALCVIPAFAEEQVFVTFISGGVVTGQQVAKGASVTAPAATLIPGYTFCGYDRALTNVQANMMVNAVYVPTANGAGAIQAMKASLPTPAVTETTVAAPTAPAVQAPAPEANQNTLLQNQQAALASLQQAQQAAAAAQQAADTTAAQQAAAQQAADEAAKKAAEEAAAKKAAEEAAAKKAAEEAAAAQKAQNAGGSVPFTDKNGNSYTFTQHDWDTLMRVYGTEEILREHLLGDLIRAAEYFG